MSRALRLLRARFRSVGRRRSLVGNILVLQLTLAAAVGTVALTGLWWASSRVIQDYMREWGEQWLDTLDELGAPLFMSSDNGKWERIETYVDNFSEISFARYYSASGEPIFAEFGSGGDPGIPALDARVLAEMSSRSEHDARYTVDTELNELPIVRIAKPMWARSLSTDGLLGFDPDTSAVDEKVIGYVELGLDFSGYRTYLVRTILTGVLISAAVLVLVTVASWLVYRRALRPLFELQVPLARLAAGRPSASLAISGHREIAAIAKAVNTTVSALQERDKKVTELESLDALTGLINRHTFAELLEQEMTLTDARGHTSALLLIDLDQFKYVNESVGHPGGDELLKLAADRLLAGAGPHGVLARFGGDEFMVLFRGVDKDEAVSIGEALVKRMQDEPFFIGTLPVNIRCSVGISMIRGRRLDPARLLSQADMACHRAKANGRNQVHLYKTSSKEGTDTAAESAWSQQIQRALKQEAFVLHYQPIVNIRTRETAYYEVLLRMLLDEERLVPPATFLPAATRFGLMFDIDLWVISQALQRLAQARAVHGDVRFTVNVSAGTFERPEFFDYIQDHLRANDVPLDALVIEITEQTAVQNLQVASTQMNELVERGCRFAIDDFGSGYCSYNYLKTLPVAFVKIDGSFIANLADDTVNRKIVTAICEIADAAGCETIAEHVEDYETFLLLGEIGVAYAQGYALGKPTAKIRSATLPVPFAARTRSPAPRRAGTRHRAP
jgi:diguanylate cyclase (GGDEF)-like protein